MSYKKAEEDLQNTLVKTFLSNLSFLYEYDRDLYIKIDELSNMINEGKYKEKYSLEFLEEEGDFDIYDIKNDKYIYNKKPKEWNDKIVNSFNLDEHNSILVLEKEVYSGGEKLNTIKSKYELFNTQDGNNLTKNDISEYVNVLEKGDKKKLKDIKKTIFIGTLLGRHISRIINKHESNLYLVVEKNLEIFRLSLFVLDLTLFTKGSGVIFSIMEDSFTYEKKVIKFLQINPFDNYLIKLCTSDINVKSYIDTTLSAILNTKPTSFDYNRILYNFIRNSSEKFSSNYNIICMNTVKEKFKNLKDKPVLYIAAGPSLDEKINWIKEKQENFFIVTVGAAVKKLIENDIKIDMVFSLDPQLAVMIVKQFPDEIIPKLNETLIFASIITHEKLLDKFDKDNLFIFEVFQPFIENNITLNVSSVGELGLGMLLYMNTKDIYLIGLDFALNKNTGATHSEGTSNIKEIKEDKMSIDKETFGLRTRTFEVKGNFEDKVKTTGLFSSSIYHINTMLKDKNDKVNIYNLSEHGAYFNNTIPEKITNISFEQKLNKKILFSNIRKELKSHTINSLGEKETLEIKEEIKYLENILKVDFDILKKYKFNSYDEFYLLIKELLVKITSYRQKVDILTILINNHTQIIFNYLNYKFNDSKIKKENKKVENIKYIYLEQLEEVLENYVNYLKNMLK